MNPIEERAFYCPHCGETISTLVDIETIGMAYIEDCSVCCCPNEITAQPCAGLDGTMLDDIQLHIAPTT